MDASPNPEAWYHRDWSRLALLVLLVLPLRLWLLGNTEVAARDSIGYIRYALQLDHMDWGEVLRANQQHPGYAFSVWVVSLPVRAIAGWEYDAYRMQTCAQIASGLAAILLLFPMYFLGKTLWDGRVGFWGTLLFQYMPVSAHHLSDGVSESLFWLWVVAALLQGVRALQTDHLGRFGLCGIFAGLAYLTRPEGAFVLAAASLVLAGRQLTYARSPWRRFLLTGTAMMVPACLIGSLYVWTTGALTNKLSPRFIFGLENMPVAEAVDAGEEGAGNAALQGNVLASFIRPSASFWGRTTRSLQALAAEFIQGLHYLGALAALLGGWWSWGRLRTKAGFWLLATYMFLQAVTLVALGNRVFYISDRHVMVLVLLTCFPMAYGIITFPHRVGAWKNRHRPGPAWQPTEATATWGTLLLVCMMLYSLPKTLEPLHGNRRGNHEAGLWLAQQLRDGDLVVDDHCWSHYFAGQVFLEGKEPAVPPGHIPTCFVVMTRSRNRAVAEERNETEAGLRNQGGRIVYHWPVEKQQDQAKVVVYALPRDFRAYPWKVAE